MLVYFFPTNNFYAARYREKSLVYTVNAKQLTLIFVYAGKVRPAKVENGGKIVVTRSLLPFTFLALNLNLFTDLPNRKIFCEEVSSFLVGFVDNIWFIFPLNKFRYQFPNFLG